MLKHILSQTKDSTLAKAPCFWFKEWTLQDDLQEQEFTLAIIVTPIPPNIAFGPFNYEREPVQMVRCITAGLLHDKYNIAAAPGDVYQPATNWWFLITAQLVSDQVDPQILITFSESLRTMTSITRITCFHIIDLYRGKLKFEWWLEMIIAILSGYPRIRFLDEWTHWLPETYRFNPLRVLLTSGSGPISTFNPFHGPYGRTWVHQRKSSTLW